MHWTAGSSLYFPKASDAVNNDFSEIDHLNSDLFKFYGPEQNIYYWLQKIFHKGMKGGGGQICRYYENMENVSTVRRFRTCVWILNLIIITTSNTYTLLGGNNAMAHSYIISSEIYDLPNSQENLFPHSS